MIKTIRKPRFLKIVSVFMAILFINEIIFPTVAMALTGGPSQPEVESFAPIEATDMVDLFSGDFKYNIPLMDVDGYPININYNANITMDQEASWVGLGWNLNPGVISRSMRGLPDEFCGDLITKEFNFKEDKTYGLRVNLRPEIVSKSPDLISLGYSISYSTKNGFNVEQTLGITPTIAKVGAGSINAGLNFSSSSNGDFNFTPSVSYQYSIEETNDQGKPTNSGKKSNIGGKIGFPINSIGGLRAMQLGVSVNNTLDKNGKRYNEGSLSLLNSTLSFVPNTYTPQISIPLQNESYDINLNFGTDVMVVDALGAIGGFYLSQSIREKTIVKPSYGYLNNAIGVKNFGGLLDFNREKDVTYHPEIKNLPITNRTYDIYSVQGQGVSGTFRSYSNDVSFVFDDFNQNISSSYNGGVEIAATNVVKGGADLTYNDVITSSNIWYGMNAYVPDYYTATNNNLLYENTNFKMVGELSVESDMNYIDYTSFKKATRLDLYEFGGLDAVLKDRDIDIKGYSNDKKPARLKREHRQKRNQFISVLNGNEASTFGVEKNICSYIITQHDLNAPTTHSIIERSNPVPYNQSSSYSGRHPSEVTINKTDGSRYVYGIPAYVTKQVESSFSVDELITVPSNGLVDYNEIQDSKSNETGQDYFYSKTILPPYAHSYLLTNVLSPEFIDLTGDGPTDDDMGNYTKFKYSSMYTNTGEYYKWRTPFEYGKASYNEGIKYLDNDGKGSYIYGEKDIWYLHSIETKNYIVDFILSERCDGYGVMGDRGGRNAENLQRKLKEIRLYSKKDKIEHPSTAIAIKVVHFEYDYSLCKGIPNNNTGFNDVDVAVNQGGKLTLKKIYFTYSESNKGKLNPYQFTYNTYNPDYKPKACDRWGFYKPEINDQLGVTMNSFEFPYVDQRKVNTDNYVSSWSLSEITTPSGATIKMKYESDDYAYVQDKRAMQMMQVIGFSLDIPTSASSTSSMLYTYITGIPSSQNSYNYIVLKVPELVSNTEIRKKYLEGVDQLYFKCLVNMSQGEMEYISGYARIDNYGVVGGGTSDYIWIKIADFEENDNPISAASWRYCMESARHFLTGNSAPDESNAVDVIKSIIGLGLLSGLIDLIRGPRATAKAKGIAQTFDPTQSWVRLDNPNFKKLGGGSRISKITISDNWTPDTKEYGQEYNYTMLENGNEISSGVAAYEPMVGADEIPQRTAVFYKTAGGFMQPDSYGFLENPLGESFFPAPNVGYRKVTVRNLQNSNITKHATGKVEHEFYTAKEFPVRNNSVTDLKAIPYKSGWLANIFSPDTYNKMYTSQGYLIETNDMHGKPRSQKVYAEGKAFEPISGVEYYYKLTTDSKLNNVVNTIDKKGSINKRLVGFDYDVVNDFRECNTATTQTGCQINISFFFAGIFPIVIPPVWPTYSFNKTLYRSAVTTKVINYYGVLQDVIKFDQSSRVKTSNELYDAETGEVLLTKTQNSFKDSLFSFTYPAHWVYKGMEPAFENTGFELNGNHTITSGVISLTNDLYDQSLRPSIINKSARELFSSGDEIRYSYKIPPSTTINSAKAWVLDVTKDSVSLINELGNPVPDGILISLKVMRSGRKNQQSLPIASLTSRKNPIPYLLTNSLQDAGILESEAVEYDNVRKIYCGENNISCKEAATQEYIDVINLYNYLLTHNKITTYPSTYLTSLPCNKIIPINLLSPEYYPNYFTNLLKSKFQIPSGQNAIYFTGIVSGVTGSFVDYFITIDPTNLDSYFSQSPQTNFINLNIGDDISDVKYFITQSLQSFSIENPCIDNTDFKWTSAKYISNTNNSIVSIDVQGHMEGRSYNNEPINASTSVYFQPFSSCGLPPGELVNPFINGILGNWQPRTSYKFLAKRKRTESTDITTNLKIDGDYLSFTPFWKFNQIGKLEWSKANPFNNNWVWTNTVTIKDRNGSEVENKNALSIYSSALYGFSGNLAVAVAANAKHKEIVSESFEELSDSFSPECSRHFNLLNSSNFVKPDYAHSGKYGLKISNGTQAVFYTHTVLNDNFIKIGDVDCESRWSSQVLETNDEAITNGLIMNESDCKAKFSPDPNKDYLVSYWIYSPNGTIASQTNPLIVLNVMGTGVSLELISVGKPIEGWQRVEQIIHFNSLATGSLNFSFINNGSYSIYLDDLRILPQSASMKAYVYDDISKRLMAELDDNNYASFYEYDEDGSLVRIKKETEKGVFTIKEIRKNLQK